MHVTAELLLIGKYFIQVRSFGKQLLESVAYLHDLQLIHTDLKPENILLASLEYSKHSEMPTTRWAVGATLPGEISCLSGATTACEHTERHMAPLMTIIRSIWM